jgi:hypothetical protein
MSESLRGNVLWHLRDLYQCEGPEWWETTEDIARGVGVEPGELYNQDTDTGLLADLKREGLVDGGRGLDARDRAKWVAKPVDVRIVW